MKLQFKLITAFVFCAQSVFLFSQDLPTINKTGKKPEHFIPKGWEIIGQAKGDVNKDGLDDFVLVIKDIEEDMNDDKEYPRLLLVLFSTKEKSFVLYISTANAVLCKKCGGVSGDPFQSLAIKNGEISVEHYGGSAERWGISAFFKWDGKDLMLLREIRSSSNSNDPENSYQEKIKTASDFGKIQLQSFDINKEY